MSAVDGLEPIPVNEPVLNGNEKKYLAECIDTGWVSSDGPFVKRFEGEFAETVSREHGIAVNFGSLDMIEQYGERVSGVEITLRINPGFGHGHSRKTNTGGEHSKHGIWHESLEEALERCARCDLRVSGVHVHIGSGTDMEHLATVCEAVESLACRVAEAGGPVRMISAGGGLPVPYRAEDPSIDTGAYYTRWDATRKRLEKRFGHRVRLEIEPGRYLVAEAGYLVAEIRAIKQMGRVKRQPSRAT